MPYAAIALVAEHVTWRAPPHDVIFTVRDVIFTVRFENQAERYEGKNQMRCTILKAAAAGVACTVTFACARDMPVSPTRPTAQQVPAGVSDDVGTTVRAPEGIYQLSFLDGNLQPIASLPAADEELILGAHVSDGNGEAAQRGRVVFEYCSLRGLPPNDITRPDEAPSAACDTGSATWATLTGIELNASGNAYLNFGVVLIPRTVGFRFRYVAQGSGIASRESDPADFTWVSAG